MFTDAVLADALLAWAFARALGSRGGALARPHAARGPDESAADLIPAAGITIAPQVWRGATVVRALR